MAEDRFTQVTTRSLGSRFSSAVGGVIIGAILFIGSIVLLFWNEGNAVAYRKSLDEGARNCVSVACDKVDPANDKKLVHLTGPANSDQELADDQFPVSARGIKLIRKVEMYQWKEESKSEKRKKLGGGEETVTTYTYRQGWFDEPIDSGKFARPEGHANPGRMPFERAAKTASNVTLGAFTLPADLVNKISTAQPVQVGAADLARLPAELKPFTRSVAGGFYVSANYASRAEPATSRPDAALRIGDVQVEFHVVPNCTVSVIGRQIGNTFEKYDAGKAILMLSEGSHSAEEMFAAAKASLARWTWIRRLIGFAAMFIGIMMAGSPLAVLADVIPFVGDLLRLGMGLVALVISLALSLATIAIGWLFYRPVLGLGLLVVAGLIIGLGVFLARKARAPAKA